MKITSITDGPRQSNIEMLRIIAMFLVLVVHATFFSTGSSTCEDFESNPIGTFTKIIFQSLSIVCVNVFVLISGWFGIRASIKGITNFIFQCVFFSFGIYIIFMIIGLATFTLKGLATCFCLTDYWFIVSYVALYILSPVLNTFVSYTPRKQFKYILISFFVFQTIWGWIGTQMFINSGYSCFSFIGLYLMARYISFYRINKRSAWWLGVYGATVIANSILYFICEKYNIPLNVYAYVNPLVIIGSLGLFLFFVKIKIASNKFINWIAKSAFAVYLLHCNPNIMTPIFKHEIQSIYDSASGVWCLMDILMYLIAFFCIAILLDQPRRWCWNLIFERYLFKK